MRYWTYMNNEVLGPFEKEKLAKLPNFTSSSLICPETPVGEQANAWKEASTYPEVSAVLTLPVPAPVKPWRPEESPLALTMRGSLIADPVAMEPVAVPPALSAPKPITALKPGVLEPPKEAPRSSVPDKPRAMPENITAGSEPDPRLEPLKQKVEEIGAALVSIRKSQAQLLDEVGRLESAVTGIKALLSSEPQKK